MISKQSQKFKVAKQKVRRRKRRREILKFIFRKLLFLSIFQKLFRMLIKYLFLTSIAAIIGFKVGNQSWEQNYQRSIQQQKELIQLRNIVEESKTSMETKRNQMDQLTSQLYQSLKNQKDAEDSWNQTLKKLSIAEMEQQQLSDHLKDFKKTHHQLELENLKSQKDLEFLKHQLVTKDEKLVLIQEKLHQKITLLEKATKDFLSLQQKIEKSELEKRKLDSSFQLLQQQLKFNQEKFDEKVSSLEKGRHRLELEIALQEDQLRLKQLKIEELINQLQTQTQFFQDEINRIRFEVGNLSQKMETLEAKKRLDWILSAIDKLLIPKIKFF